MFETNDFKTSKGLVDALVRRQGVLSNNLTNIGVKGYVRQDIDFNRVLSDLKNNNSFDQDNGSVLSKAQYQDHSKPMTLESEMSKLYDNYLRYLLLVKSIGHHFEHMKKALEVRAS